MNGLPAERSWEGCCLEACYPSCLREFTPLVLVVAVVVVLRRRWTR